MSNRFSKGSRRGRGFLCALLLGMASCVGDSSVSAPVVVPSRSVGAFYALALQEQFNDLSISGVSACNAALYQLEGSAFPTFATVYGLAGDDWTCVERFARENAGRPHVIQVYLYYDVVKLPSSGELAERAIAVRDRFLELATSGSHLAIMLALEDRFSDEEFASAAEYVENLAHVRVGRNPLFHSASSLGRSKELHGTGALCSGETSIASQDGFIFSLSESREWALRNASCETILLWDRQWQGLCEVNGEPFKCVPLEERVSVFPSVAEYRLLFEELSNAMR